MKDLKPTCRVAVIQAAPLLFRKDACVEKAVSLILEAARLQAELIVFPELFIPGYPFGMTFGFTVGHRDEGGRQDWKRYYDNSILVPGPETELLGRAAREAGAWVSIGVSERDAVTPRCITPTCSSPRTDGWQPATANSSPPERSGWSGATPTGPTSRWRRPPGAPWAA